MVDSENRLFFVRARKNLAHDCMDAGGRVTPGAVTELTQLSQTNKHFQNQPREY